jgi:hypothetical protein
MTSANLVFLSVASEGGEVEGLTMTSFRAEFILSVASEGGEVEGLTMTSAFHVIPSVANAVSEVEGPPPLRRREIQAGHCLRSG